MQIPLGYGFVPLLGQSKKGSLLQSLPFTKAVLHKICTVTERVQIKYLELYTCLIDSRWSVERSTFPVNLTSDRKYFTASIANMLENGIDCIISVYIILIKFNLF